MQHFTVKLTHANIASISFRMANNKHPDLMKFAEYEEIAFTYQKIDWTWNDGGITAGDDWETPVRETTDRNVVASWRRGVVAEAPGSK